MNEKISSSMLIPLAPKTATETMESERVINFANYRVSAARISRDEITHTAATAALMKTLQKSMDKMLLNSFYGSMAPSRFIAHMFEKPAYTAQMIHMERSEINELEWRVKIRCPNWEQTGSTFPSESHACEDFAAREVKPWIDANCAGYTLHMNYAVFAFADETDAHLCYMRFK